jgi:SAM-dependent methyltransferase
MGGELLQPGIAGLDTSGRGGFLCGYDGASCTKKLLIPGRNCPSSPNGRFDSARMLESDPGDNLGLPGYEQGIYLGDKSVVDDSVIAQAYGEIAVDYYNHKRNEPNPCRLIEWPALLAEIDGYAEDKRVLDLGTGTGGLIHDLLKRHKPSEVWGVDISQGMLDVAQVAFSRDDSVRFRQTSAADLPFRDESFGVVVSSNALDCMRDVELVLAEANRVLKQGGRLVFSIRHPNRNRYYARNGQRCFAGVCDGEDDYFREGWYLERWPGSGKRGVPRYYRTWENWVAAVTGTGFMITGDGRGKLFTPKPNESLQITNPDIFAKYSSRPGALIFSLRKP